MAPITDQQWAAARAIAEGNPGTHALIAACMGVHATTVSHRSTQDKWETIDYRHGRIRRAMADVAELSRRVRAGEELEAVGEGVEDAGGGAGAVEPVEEPEPWPDEPPAARMARIGAVLTRHTETILRRMEAGRPLDSRQVASLSGLVALCDRIAAMAREEATRQEAQSDDDLAETMRTIDMRIIYLARGEARRLAAEVFGIPQEEVDAKLPEPVEEPLPRRRRRRGPA